MTNKRNTDMAKAAMLGLFGLLVIIIIGVALAIYFTGKKSDDEETSDKPEFTFDENAKKTINPEESGSQEGYRIIEYAESDLDKSKLIDLTLSWQTGAGFDKVNKIIFTRYVGGTKIQDNIEVTDANMIKDYGTGSVTFKGSDVKASAKGENVIKAYWNEVNESKWLATAKLSISEEDFNYTLTGPFGDLNVPVTIVGDTFKLEKRVKKTYYQISHAPGQWFNVDQNSNDGTIKFKFDDGTFLKFGDKDTFKLMKYKNKKVVTTSDGKNVWVPNKQLWKTIGNLDKDDFRFAQCDLMGATTIMSSDELLTPNDSKLWKSPNGEWRAVYKNDGNFVVYKENDSNNTVSASTGSNDSARLTLSANGNIAFWKANGTTLVKSSGGHKFSTKQGLKPPFRFIVSDFGGLHVISKEGTEVMSSVSQFYGPLSNYYKTHAGDLWGFNLNTYHGSKFFKCAELCDDSIMCAGFTYNHKDKQCYTKDYGSRILGVASDNDQNADRWSNTKENSGTEWLDGTQYYQKKIETLCYRDRYPELLAVYGNNATSLKSHYFSDGINEGLNARCDTTRPENSILGWIDPIDDTTGYKDYTSVTKMSAKECKEYAKNQGNEVWGYITPAHSDNKYHNTCYAYSTGELAKKGSLKTGYPKWLTGCVNGKTLESGCTQE